ncbi:MAG: radical SAM protein [Nitrospirae bacterium]|nr:radical SAM protein [Nitrospirota bacterium]
MEINNRQLIYINMLHYPVQVLGIGSRIGIWFQGCSIGCKGCMAQHTWQVHEKYGTDIGSVMREILRYMGSKPDGITISGGEPFDQPDALFELLMGIKNAGLRDVMLYSGYQFDALKSRYQYIVDLIDVLIDGRYMQGIETDYVWKGSANQNANIITQDAMLRIRYDSYLKRRPEKRKLQIVEAPNGVYMVGIPRQGDAEAMQVVQC